MKSRLIAGIFSLLLVLLVIVGPVYLSEKLEVIQASNENIISTRELESTESTIEYESYLEGNSESAGYNLIGFGIDELSNSVMYDYPNTDMYLMDSAFDVDGDYDLYYNADLNINPHGILSVYYVVDFEDILENNIDYMYFEIVLESSSLFVIKEIKGLGLDSDGNQLSSYSFNVPSDYKTDTHDENFTYEYNIEYSDLVNAESTVGGENQNFIQITFDIYEYAGENIYLDWKMDPEYYEIIESSGGNTTLIPYVQSTPYSVHKVSMGVGGILIIIVGLVASPLPIGEAFNGIFPVSGFTPKRTKRRRKR